jgi:hypothetical protein
LTILPAPPGRTAHTCKKAGTCGIYVWNIGKKEKERKRKKRIGKKNEKIKWKIQLHSL